MQASLLASDIIAEMNFYDFPTFVSTKKLSEILIQMKEM